MEGEEVRTFRKFRVEDVVLREGKRDLFVGERVVVWSSAQHLPAPHRSIPLISQIRFPFCSLTRFGIVIDDDDDTDDKSVDDDDDDDADDDDDNDDMSL